MRVPVQDGDQRRGPGRRERLLEDPRLTGRLALALAGAQRAEQQAGLVTQTTSAGIPAASSRSAAASASGTTAPITAM